MSIQKTDKIKNQTTAQNHAVVGMATRDEFQTIVEDSSKKEEEQGL